MIVPSFIQTHTVLLRHASVLKYGLHILRTKRLYARKPGSRDEQIKEQDRFSHMSISQLDKEFDLFNDTVTRMVDLGFAPGNWLLYAQKRLSEVYSVEPHKLNTICTVVGFDILFCQAPKGTYSIQGNIYSQNAHSNILDLLKKRTYILEEARKKSKLNSESSTKDNIEADITRLASKVSSLTIENKLAYFDQDMDLGRYQADLILSDLTTAFLQRDGFFNNTMAKPFIRSRENELLRQPLVNPHEAHLDLADAAMLLCCDSLAKNGTFVLRLADVRPGDQGLGLLQRRLEKMFQSVERWRFNHVDPRLSLKEVFFICKKKLHKTYDKYDLFDVRQIQVEAKP